MKKNGCVLMGFVLISQIGAAKEVRGIGVQLKESDVGWCDLPPVTRGEERNELISHEVYVNEVFPWLKTRELSTGNILSYGECSVVQNNLTRAIRDAGGELSVKLVVEVDTIQAILFGVKYYGSRDFR